MRAQNLLDCLELSGDQKVMRGRVKNICVNIELERTYG
jgi:hypothetical protein